MKGYEKKKAYKNSEEAKWDGIEVQRGREKRLGSQGDDGMGKYLLTQLLINWSQRWWWVVGRSKLLNNSFFFFLVSPVRLG